MLTSTKTATHPTGRASACLGPKLQARPGEPPNRSLPHVPQAGRPADSLETRRVSEQSDGTWCVIATRLSPARFAGVTELTASSQPRGRRPPAPLTQPFTADMPVRGRHPGLL
jgi:hypothetical protein